MLVVETIGKIRRAYFVQGKPIKAICRELKVSRKVVRKVLRSGVTSFEYERHIQPRPKLGRWTAELRARSRARPSKMASCYEAISHGFVTHPADLPPSRRPI